VAFVKWAVFWWLDFSWNLEGYVRNFGLLLGFPFGLVRLSILAGVLSCHFS